MAVDLFCENYGSEYYGGTHQGSDGGSDRGMPTDVREVRERVTPDQLGGIG